MAAPIYSHRPSKQVSRLMLVETLLRLGPIAAPSGYQYVGFGALEFVDFDLIHRRLGVSTMFSIESDHRAIARYEANRPYNGIRILTGRATDQLATIDWKKLSIVWLDYTGMLNTEVIADVQHLCRELLPGSVLAVTLNAHPAKLAERRSTLAAAVGDDRVPLGVTDATLGDWGTARTQYDILTAIIRSTLADRMDAATWRQILNINYRDNARMQLVAGVVSGQALERTVDLCAFSDLDFVRGGSEPLMIEVPYLTPKERRSLNEQLPRAPRRRLTLPGVDKKEIDAYASVYRWFGTSA